MSAIPLDKASSYLEYLPAIFQEGEDGDAFIGRFLKIFEKLLSGINDAVTDTSAPGAPALGYDIFKLPIKASSHINPGIEQTIDKIHEFFDPELTPDDFLQWLAGWMALMLRDDWEEVKKRRLISRIMSLYRMRGTKKGLEEYLKIYVSEGGVKITEIVSPFQIGVTSTIGKDTYLGGGPPHYFLVEVIFPEPTIESKKLREDAVRAILDLEKPAHTYYHLETFVPTLQIEVWSTIGRDTLLGDIP